MLLQLSTVEWFVMVETHECRSWCRRNITFFSTRPLRSHAILFLNRYFSHGRIRILPWAITQLIFFGLILLGDSGLWLLFWWLLFTFVNAFIHGDPIAAHFSWRLGCFLNFLGAILIYWRRWSLYVNYIIVFTAWRILINRTMVTRVFHVWMFYNFLR